MLYYRTAGECAKWIREHYGLRVAASTVRRWMTRGVRGVKLWGCEVWGWWMTDLRRLVTYPPFVSMLAVRR